MISSLCWAGFLPFWRSMHALNFAISYVTNDSLQHGRFMEVGVNLMLSCHCQQEAKLCIFED